MRRNVQKAMMVSALVILILGSQVVGAQGKPSGKITRSYRENEGRGRPSWVEASLGHALSHIKTNGAAYGLRDAEAELTLRSADEDDFGLTHVRLDQVKDGVPVFGGQLIAHLDASNVRDVSGRTFASEVGTKPSINAARAEQAAVAALGYQDAFANKPEAKLVVLPNEYSNVGSVLTYQVELLVEDGTDATGRYKYFIDANTGTVVFAFNNMDKVGHTGSGKSLYSSTVGIGTDLVSGSFYLRDTNRGGMYTTDMKNRTIGSGTTFTDADNIWGDGTNSNRQSAAVDAHFGAAQTWDYYLTTHNRLGIDNKGFRVLSRVHYGRNYNNAFWNGTSMTYGDGDGSQFTPLVSLDVVGHEITHGVTEKTADLVYANESGALNESFSDIFGTAVEFSAGGVGGRPADYLIAEDIYLVADTEPGFRNMKDPGEDNDPDNYSIRLYPDPCSPTSNNDNCGVHSNSGIQNNAFYLLAESGTNKTSGKAVTGITRAKAENIFYRALTLYLVPSSNFSNARAATLKAAADLYGAGSAEYNATAQAWTAVGVTQ